MKDLPPVTPFRATKTARIAHLGPPDAERSLWVCLHGYRQLAPWFLRHFRAFDDGSRRLLAPEALNRFYVGDPDGRHGPQTRVGATWMTREEREHEIEDHVRYLDEVLDDAQARQPDRPVLVVGFSQGAHTAARWMHRSEHDVRGVVLWGEGLPHDTTLRDLTARPRRWFLVRGEADASRNRAQEARDEERLDAAGVSWKVRYHPGGHRVEPGPLREIVRDLGL